MAYHAEILLGTIIKSCGFEGAVLIKPEKVFEKKVPEVESVFLEIEGKPVPFFISSCETAGNGLIRLSFDGYDSVGKINEFIGCRVFLTSGIMVEKPVNDLNKLIDYQIKTTNNEIQGNILGIIENPGQVILNVKTAEGRQILIPFHEDLIIKVDSKKKIITMDLPEGLKDLNDPEN